MTKMKYVKVVYVRPYSRQRELMIMTNPTPVEIDRCRKFLKSLGYTVLHHYPVSTLNSREDTLI